VSIQSLRISDSIDEVIEKYSKMVYRLALAYVKAAHDAEDVFQEVFLRYISKPRIFENEEHRKAWLIRVTINRCKSHLSSSWLRKTVPLDSTLAYEDEIANDLSEYLALLPEKYRPIIHLFYCEEMTTKQISEILHVKESTVRSWLARARAILRDKLKGNYQYE